MPKDLSALRGHPDLGFLVHTTLLVPVLVALGNVLGWQSLLGVAAVPVGLWVAARIQRRHAL